MRSSVECRIVPIAHRKKSQVTTVWRELPVKSLFFFYPSFLSCLALPVLNESSKMVRKIANYACTLHRTIPVHAPLFTYGVSPFCTTPFFDIQTSFTLFWALLLAAKFAHQKVELGIFATKMQHLDTC